MLTVVGNSIQKPQTAGLYLIVQMTLKSPFRGVVIEDLYIATSNNWLSFQVKRICFIKQKVDYTFHEGLIILSIEQDDLRTTTYFNLVEMFLQSQYHLQ